MANLSPRSVPSTGITAMGLAVPPAALSVDELAHLRGVDPAKYRVGLGCREIALCTEDCGVVELACTAARRALDSWGGDLGEVGLLAVGTESALDMSRPLSAWIAERLELQGAVRSYEVKHACYGGTLALRQALEWRLSGAARHKVALVVMVDSALYAPGHPGEPTQGAGAVALLVGPPSVAEVEPVSYTYSKPAFDFWRPVGEAYPRVQGKLSLDCYKEGAAACFQAWAEDGEAAFGVDEALALCLHAPFPRMVEKAMAHVGESLGWSPEATARTWSERVAPHLAWNRMLGNAYTASLWISVAHALAGSPEGTPIAAFSYGSGFGAELLLLRAGPGAAARPWVAPFEAEIRGRELLSAEAYSRLRRSHPEA